jgi:hypothetical protein
MNMSPRHRFSTILIAAAILSLAGCKTPLADSMKLSHVKKLNEHMPWHDEDAPREGVPNRLVDNWQDAVHSQQGKTPTRGFAGKIFFYDDEGGGPILVDGELVIYAFNEKGRVPTDNMPTRRYVFPATELSKLADKSQTELGYGYNVWLPWDEVGGPQTEVSLICRFEPKNGATLVSKQTKGHLPGEETPAAYAAGGQRPKMPEGVHFTPAVEQAGYVPLPTANSNVIQTAAAIPSMDVTTKLNATTILLPQSMQNLGPGMPVSPAGQTPVKERTIPMFSTPQANHPQAANQPVPTESRLASAMSGNAVSTGYRLSQTPANGSDISIKSPVSVNIGISANSPNYPPRKTYVEQATPHVEASNSNAAPTQNMIQGYSSHPLAAAPTNPITPISANNQATVTYGSTEQPW